MRIAVLGGEGGHGGFVSSVIEMMKHQCHLFGCSDDIMRSLRRESYDMLILGWFVSDGASLMVLEWLHSHGKVAVPVLFIGSHSAGPNAVQALCAGADDYVGMPVSAAELRARIAALLRRAYPSRQQEICQFGDYTFDRKCGGLSINGVPVSLKRKEVELAFLFFSNMGRLLSRQHILETIWGISADLNSHTLNTHVSRIRSVLHLDALHGYHLQTVYSAGYRLEALAQRYPSAPAPISLDAMEGWGRSAESWHIGAFDVSEGGTAAVADSRTLLEASTCTVAPS